MTALKKQVLPMLDRPWDGERGGIRDRRKEQGGERERGAGRKSEKEREGSIEW